MAGRTKKDTVRVHVSLRRPVLDAIQKMAKESGRDRSEVINDVMETHWYVKSWVLGKEGEVNE